MPYAWYARVFKLLVIKAKLSPLLKPDLARIGAATKAAVNGVPEDKIKRRGRWVSGAEAVASVFPCCHCVGCVVLGGGFVPTLSKNNW